MKAIGILFVYLFSITYLLFVPNIASADTITTLQVPENEYLGMNYYHESMGYIIRTSNQVRDDLSNIKHVTSKIKIYHNPYNSSNLPNIKNIAQIAKEEGLYVVWVENNDSITLTDANWGNYETLVVSDADHAESVGADEFVVGNEISIHNNDDDGFSDTNLPLNIKALADDVDDVFLGTVSYQEGWWKDSSWSSSGLGVLDKIYFTLYEPWDQYKSSLDNIVNAFGSSAEIGEMSARSFMSDLNYSESDWTRELMRRYDYARQKGIVIWPFAFRETTNDSFGLFQHSPAESAHEVWGYLEKTYTLRYTEYLSDNFNDGDTGEFGGDGVVSSNRLEADEFETTTASISENDYVYRGVALPVSTSGADTWRVMRLAFRYTDNDNYYFLSVSANENKIFLYRREDGIETWLGETTTSLEYESQYSFEIRINGQSSHTEVEVFWDGEKVFDVMDTGNSSLNSGALGMRNNGIRGQIDDVLVTGFENVIQLKNYPAHPADIRSPNSISGWVYDITVGPNYIGTDPDWILGYGWANLAMANVSSNSISSNMHITINRKSVHEMFEYLDRTEEEFVFPWQQGLAQVGDYYEFRAYYSKEGSLVNKFSHPVTIVVPYYPEFLYGKNPSRLRIARLNEETNKWEILRNNTVLDWGKKNLSNTVDSLGYFALVYLY